MKNENILLKEKEKQLKKIVKEAESERDEVRERCEYSERN